MYLIYIQYFMYNVLDIQHRYVYYYLHCVVVSLNKPTITNTLVHTLSVGFARRIFMIGIKYKTLKF